MSTPGRDQWMSCVSSLTWALQTFPTSKRGEHFSSKVYKQSSPWGKLQWNDNYQPTLYTHIQSHPICWKRNQDREIIFAFLWCCQASHKATRLVVCFIIISMFWCALRLLCLLGVSKGFSLPVLSLALPPSDNRIEFNSGYSWKDAGN